MKKAIFLVVALAITVGIILMAFKKDKELSTVPDSPSVGPEIDTDKKPKPDIKLPGILDSYGDGAYPPSAVPPTENWEDGYFPQLNAPDPNSPYVTLKTNMGEIRLVLYPEAAPLTVKNFIVHCQEGYYNKTEFHRIIKDFMIQGGDPTMTGVGGDSIYGAPFREEINEHLHHFPGALSMANAGPCLNGSQFFIVQGDEFKRTYKDYKKETYKFTMQKNMLSTEVYTEFYDYIFAENPNEEELKIKFDVLTRSANSQLANGYKEDFHIDKVMDIYPELGGSPHLDYQYTVFGQVVSGMEVVNAIANIKPTENTATGKKVVIESTIVENAPNYDTVSNFSVDFVGSLTGVQYYTKIKKTVEI